MSLDYHIHLDWTYCKTNMVSQPSMGKHGYASSRPTNLMDGPLVGWIRGIINSLCNILAFSKSKLHELFL